MIHAASRKAKRTHRATSRAWCLLPLMQDTMLTVYDWLDIRQSPAVAYSQQCWAVILFGGRVALRNARVRADRRLLGRLAGKHILELHHYALRDQIRNCRL